VEQKALFNPKTSILIQKRHPYPGNLNRETSGDSKNAFLHCGDVLAPLKHGGVWAGGEEYSKYKQQVVEMVKAGQLVVQMLAAEETIAMPDGSRKATFTQETWDMVRHPWEQNAKIRCRRCMLS